MSDANQKKLYIAGMGMITPLGHNVASTLAAIRTNKSAYSISEYRDLDDSLITMAQLPNELFDEMEIEVATEQAYCGQMDRILKMTIIAIQEACSHHRTLENLPLVLAMSEPDVVGISQSLLAKNLEIQFPRLITSAYTRACPTGRAAGIDCVKFVFDYLAERFNYILIGGGDSHSHTHRLQPLKEKSRLLTHKNNDGFAPGEAASYLLLTPSASLA